MKQLRKKLQICAGVILFLCIFWVLFVKVNRVLEKKEGQNRFAEFWWGDEYYDVWFIGNSHSYYAISPMELYREQGITSYNLSSPAMHTAQTYWVLRNAIEQKKDPKLVVMDTYFIHKDTPHGTDKTVHTSYDIIPMSLTKIRGAFDLAVDKADLIELLFPISMYHERWTELEPEEFITDETSAILKGGRYNSSIYDYEKMQKMVAATASENDVSTKETMGRIYLRKIIELCQEHDIDLLLTELPSYCEKRVVAAMNGVKDIAEEYQVPFLNMQYLDLVNPYTDYGDYGHVNVSGTFKLTNYMGTYLKEQYDLTDHRLDEKAQKWDRDLAVYTEIKPTVMKEKEWFKEILPWLYDPYMKCRIYMKEGVPMDEQSLALYHNIYDKEEITYEEAVRLNGGEFDGEIFLYVTLEGREEPVLCNVYKDKKLQK